MSSNSNREEGRFFLELGRVSDLPNLVGRIWNSGGGEERELEESEEEGLIRR